MQDSRPLRWTIPSPGPSYPQNPTSRSFENLDHLEQDLVRIPPVFLTSMKLEAGIPDVPFNELTYEQKVSLDEVFKRTMSNFNGTLATGPRTVRPGPPGTSPSFNNSEFQQLENDLARQHPLLLVSLKREAGVPDVQFNELTDEQKRRVNEVFKRSMASPQYGR